MVHCSLASSGEDRLEELQQQEQAMSAFMDSFAANRAARLAELEGMQMAGSSRHLALCRAGSDVPSLPFDESQACVGHSMQQATPHSSACPTMEYRCGLSCRLCKLGLLLYEAAQTLH